MATMYPEKLPSKVNSLAEEKLYYVLKEYLPNEYTVLWNVHLNTSRRGGGREDGEIDFLVLHPQKGLLIVEVKGGKEIHYDRNLNQWYSTNHFDKTNPINHPFEQAEDCMHRLIRQLKEEANSPLLRTACRRCTFARGVIFPEVSLDKQIHTLPVQREYTLDYDDVQAPTITTSIERIYDYFTRSNDQPLGTSAINEIINNIYPRSFYIRSPLIIQLEEEDAQLEKLTEQQYFALDMLSSYKRVAIYGCAGSGKTFLAVEQARRLALRGDKVLLTCFTRNLANWLKQLLQKKAETEAALENVTVSTFHQLNSNLLRQAERRGILPSTGNRQTNINSDPFLPDVDFQTPQRSTFQDSYDERLVPIIPLLGAYYDAIIVDEGQDFDDKWWILLQALLRSKEESLLYVFYDENQIINRNGRSPKYPIPSEHHYPLPFNCRTTKKIHEAIVKYITIGKPPACKPESPEGQEIENIKVASLSEDGRTKLVELLNRLIHKEHIPLEDMVLLTPFGKDKSYFKDGLALDKGVTLSWNIDTISSKHNVLTCSSISAFKGLERKVVILAESDQIWNDKLWYVALSRAKELLIIIEQGAFLPDLPDDLP